MGHLGESPTASAPSDNHPEVLVDESLDPANVVEPQETGLPAAVPAPNRFLLEDEVARSAGTLHKLNSVELLGREGQDSRGLFMTGFHDQAQIPDAFTANFTIVRALLKKGQGYEER